MENLLPDKMVPDITKRLKLHRTKKHKKKNELEMWVWELREMEGRIEFLGGSGPEGRMDLFAKETLQ